jgi:NADPH:quinone reductase-like Zn-dependent oxidoreductase
VRARALWAESPGRCALRTEDLPTVGDDDVLVRTEVSGISRGTESLVHAGRVPASEHERMRGPHMAGRFPFPVKYGYAAVGRVEAGALSVGTPVFCLHPHQERFVVPATDVVPLPSGTPVARAVLGPNLETAINVTWDASIGVGDRVTVVGGGVVGCLVAWLAGQTAGTEVQLVDVRDRSEVARALGVSFATPSTADGDRDVVVHASGHPDGAATALRLAGVEATVVEASWFGDQPVPLPLGQAFHSRRLTLRGSQVGRIPPQRQPRFDHRRRMQLALRLAADPALDCLFDADLRFSELPDTLPPLLAPGAGGLCHRVWYGDAG